MSLSTRLSTRFSTSLATRRSLARTLGDAALVGLGLPLAGALLGTGIVKLDFLLGALFSGAPA